MRLEPRKLKYKRAFGPLISSLKEKKTVNPLFGVYCLKVQEGGILTGEQIEASFQSLKKLIKKSGKIWINVFPQRCISGKSLESRMGKGKGKTKSWVSLVREGEIIFEVTLEDKVEKDLYLGFRYAAERLPLKTKVFKYKV